MTENISKTKIRGGGSFQFVVVDSKMPTNGAAIITWPHKKMDLEY